MQQGAELTFRFDGEALSGAETAAGLELEDDDVIDVAY